MNCQHNFYTIERNLATCKACGFKAELSYLQQVTQRLMKDNQVIRANCKHDNVKEYNTIMVCEKCNEQWQDKMAFLLVVGFKQVMNHAKPLPKVDSAKAEREAKRNELATWLGSRVRLAK